MVKSQGRDIEWVMCNMCGKEILRTKGIRHHVDPSRKTKEPHALGKKDKRERNDLLFVCRECHAKIHAKLQPKRVRYRNEEGKISYKKPYKGDNPEGAIWR